MIYIGWMNKVRRTVWELCLHFSGLVLPVRNCITSPKCGSPCEDVNPEILTECRNVEDTFIRE